MKTVIAALVLGSPFSFSFASPSRNDLRISTLSYLSFGKIAPGTGGTVTMTPTGARTKSGGVTILSSGSGSTALFHLQGLPGQAFTLSLPTNNEVVLTSGVNTMKITNFTLSPPGMAALNGTGNQTVALGATLNIDSHKPPGNYSGSFTLMVDYQ